MIDLLIQEGFNVEIATNSNEAFHAILDGEKPSLLIIDVTMPLIEGDKIVVALKGNKFTKNIPMLLYSGKPPEELEALAKTTGADGYITKSTSHADIISKIRQTISAVK